MAVDRQNPLHIAYCGTENGLWTVMVSTNGGAGFTRHQIPGTTTGHVHALALDPLDNQTIYVGGSIAPTGRTQTALFKTTDGGTVWVDITCPDQNAGIGAIEVDPVDPDIIVIQAGVSVFRSEDAGSTWEDVSPPQRVRALWVNPDSANEIYAAAEGGMALSEDGGRSWMLRPGEPEFLYVSGLDIVPGVKMAFAGTSGGSVYRRRLEALFSVSIAAGLGGTTDPGPGVYRLEGGTALDITALPQSGYKFRDWSGDRSGTANPLRVTVDRDLGVKANFHLAAPEGFSVVREEARSLLRVQYINVLSWTRIMGVPGVAGYRIYVLEGGTPAFLAEVDASTSSYWHRGVSKSGAYRYALAAVDANGIEGEAVQSAAGNVVTVKRLSDRARQKAKGKPAARPPAR